MRAVVVPAVPALLPAYRSLEDPVAELRKACLEAVGWLLDDHPERVVVLGDRRVASALLAEAGFRGDVADSGEGRLLVLASGCARRVVERPGFVDEPGQAYDEHITRALATGDGDALADLDLDLGAELLASGIEGLRALGALGPGDTTVLYDDDPHDVRYWVVTWSCRS
jgi:hypothetical protein